MYKNRLQELAQRSCFNLPAYSCIREGPDHAPRFKATVNFNGETFESPAFCSTLRQAEHAAAEVALNTLAKRGPSRALAARVLDETGVYKNLLQETAHRAGLNLPVYTTVRFGPGHVPNFSCAVEIAGLRFSGDPARTKKQAQKNAALAAWSALRKLSENHLSSSSSFSLESKGNREQEQVIIARVLASLHPSESNFSESNHQHRLQNCTATSLVSTYPIPSMYTMPCQQQNRLLALTITPTIPFAPHLYPFMQSVFQPHTSLYFPSTELASVPARPNFSIATSGPSFYFSNHIVPEFSRGRSTVTISEIQEEKAEDPPTSPEDERQKHGCPESKTRNAEPGEQRAKLEWPSQWNMSSVHRPVISNPSAHSQASTNRCFTPPPIGASSMVRTMGPTYACSTPQHRKVPLAVGSRMRTGLPRSSGMLRSPTPVFVAPAVRIRSVIPVWSAPPRRSIAEEPKTNENKF
ncbi:unnamed protein product [Lupinus luteus]|uniref:DRBM domain-containing protein n=1 Tax=Lupinus luteus TaxID=3873 RepID=A0AAV1VYV4_LUPLU